AKNLLTKDGGFGGVLLLTTDRSTKQATEVHRFPEVVYVRQPPLGQAAARNPSASLAATPYLAFLDADDIWLQSKIELQLGVSLENPGLDLVSGLIVHTCSVADGMTVVSPRLQRTYPA